MKSFSLTQSGNLTALIGLVVLVLQHFKVNIAPEEIEQLVGAAVILVGIVASWVGRYRKGDLTLAGFRK